MSLHQYIGARYVPIFYQNSLDPTSTQWEPNVIYEPMTWVSLANGNMYLSKKTVPANAGDPASTPEYWMSAGQFNAYIQSLQNQINDMNDVNVSGSLQNQITTLTNDLASEVLTERVVTENTTASTEVPLEVVNYGGQGSNDVRAFVIHNYTDATGMRIDNVGIAPLMTLVNAHNAIRRSDKPSTFSGEGEFMRCITQCDPDGDDNWTQENIMIIDKNGNVWWSGYDDTGNATRNNTVHISTNKLEGGSWAYNIEAYQDHYSFMVLRSGNKNICEIMTDNGGGVRIQTGDQTQYNTILGASIGNVTCMNDGVQVNCGVGNTFRVNLAGTLKNPAYDNNFCTSSNRPTTGLYNGMMYKETDTHRIIWYLNGTWYNAMGTAV